MSMTDFQKRIIEAQEQIAGAAANVNAESINLTPDQEAVLASQVVNLEKLAANISSFLQGLGESPQEESLEEAADTAEDAADAAEDAVEDATGEKI